MPSDPSFISSHPSAASSSSRSHYSTLATEHEDSAPLDRHNAAHQRTTSATFQRSAGDRDGEPVPGNDLLRRRKPRRSGGFLLESAFDGMEDEPQEHEVVQDEPRPIDYKGKARAEPASKPDRSSKKKSRVTRIRNALGGSLRSSPLAKEVLRSEPQDGDGETSKQYNEDGRLSKDSHRASSSQGNNGAADSWDQSSESNLRPSQPAFDPTQIVHMALNLSESRRRNLSAGQLAAPLTNNRRVASLVLPPPTSVLQGSYQGFQRGGSMRTALNDQRRISRNVSPSQTGRSSPKSRHASSPINHSPTLFKADVPLDIQFSPATIARAERFQNYMELHTQYIKLMECLPELRPQSHQNARHERGRKFNPLQFIRNRKSRARARQALDPDENQWRNAPLVAHWVDTVIEASSRSDFHQDDRVRLPVYKNDSVYETPQDQVKKRPRMDWGTAPNELLADVYWLEQGENRFLIEDNHGNKIFPTRHSAHLLPPRSSQESRRPSHERSRSANGSTLDFPVGRASFDSERSVSDAGSERGRDQKHRMPESRDGSTRRHRMLPWSRARSRSSSGSSDSDGNGSDSRRPRSEVLRLTHEENTGPLKLHMKGIMNEESQRRSRSPDLLTPGTPDKWGNGQRFSISLSQDNDNALDPEPDPEKKLIERQSTFSSSASGLGHKKTDSTAREDHGPRISFEEDDSSRPVTPSSAKFAPLIGIDLSPPPSRNPSLSRRTSPTRKSKLSRLPFIRGKNKGSRDDIDLNEFANESGSSRQPSGETGDPSTTSLEKPTLKSTVSHKKNNSVNSLNQPESRGRKEGKDKEKEPQSAVTRFFKHGRIGELVKETSKVGDVIWKKEQPPDGGRERQEGEPRFEDISSESDTESDVNSLEANGKFRPSTVERQSAKPRYFDNLPTFKRTSAAPHDHIHRQQIDQIGQRSPRFDRLAPPSLDLSRVTSESSTVVMGSSQDERRQSYGFGDAAGASANLQEALDVPGRIKRGYPPTGLAKIPPRDRSRRASSINLEASIASGQQRHWSISDADHIPHPPGLSVSKADIARVRALLLCSGIKAAEIARRANSIRAPPPFLLEAAETANAQLIRVSRKEEHVLAARILSTDLENSTRDLNIAARTFNENKVAVLNEQLNALLALVADGLMSSVHEIADIADKELTTLTGDKTLQVREVNDRVEALWRRKRRRLRWIRRGGFLLLEWVLLGVMWWVWLIVVVVRSFIGVFGGFFRFVRWLFFL